ncbi:MAG: GDCCVxC domain-containing (seleno)protein [Stenotrophobium sp.]
MVESRRCALCKPRSVLAQSELICPQCGHRSSETMPADACQFFYECRNCKAMLKPRPGDCCVFCSYGSVKCPPVQVQAGCGYLSR